MKREEIVELNIKLNSLKDLEELLKEMEGEGKNHWWKISTPNREARISGDISREKLKQFIKNEIEKIKQELELED